MPRNEGRGARPRERVRADGRSRLDTYTNAGSDRKLTDDLVRGMNQLSLLRSANASLENSTPFSILYQTLTT